MVLLFFSWLSMRCALFFPKDIWALFENIKKISFSIFFRHHRWEQGENLKKISQKCRRSEWHNNTCIVCRWNHHFIRLKITFFFASTLICWNLWERKKTPKTDCQRNWWKLCCTAHLHRQQYEQKSVHFKRPWRMHVYFHDIPFYIIFILSIYLFRMITRYHTPNSSRYFFFVRLISFHFARN